ncbi:DUF7662 domain-containing protein [Phenylobacterium sp.]|jgi:hypothetical protein|uniref:DUF7662 domain-containing protein n=1 Tax=Phenylobacterium sp. TaxID=1871053 RepID=UPI002F923D04
MSKYQPLSERLAGHEGPEWRASFAEIEEVLGFPLPKTARSGKTWWSGEDKPHARAWTQHGFAAEPDHAAGHVTFRRGDIPPSAVEAVGQATELVERPAQDEPPASATGRKLPMGALVAGGVAVAAGLGAVLFRTLRRKG